MAEGEEMCPVCRSSTYLNPQMRFLVNPECYHKICESCVDRIFGTGPAPCPYRNCGKTLRRQRFKTQVFEDLSVEREVDVRQRVARIYNRPESTFPSRREYDDYLERIEALIFALAGPDGPEKEEADAEVRNYEKTHRQEILENALLQRQLLQQEEEVQRQQAERERRLRVLAAELLQQERELRRMMQQEAVQSLAAGENANIALAEAAARAKQRTDLLRKQYEMELERGRNPQVVSAAVLAQQRLAAENASPFSPFMGDKDAYPFQQQQEYFDPLMQVYVADPTLRAGGFTPQFAEFGALACAFMGVEVDIQSEKRQQIEDTVNEASAVPV